MDEVVVRVGIDDQGVVGPYVTYNGDPARIIAIEPAEGAALVTVEVNGVRLPPFTLQP